MKTKLLKETKTKRLYELSEPIRVGLCLGQNIFIKDIFSENLNRIKPEFLEKYEPLLKDVDETYYVCISDAYTHVERLVFPAIKVDDDEFTFFTDQIDGKMTFMTDGGDADSVYPDKVYLRHLCKLNGFKWEGVCDF